MYLLGRMEQSLKHVTQDLKRVGRELEKQKLDQSDLKERIDMIDRRWRSLMALGAAVTMVAANVLDKDGLHLLGEFVGFLK